MGYRAIEIIQQLPGIELLPQDTVDGFLVGLPHTDITGVAITFLATWNHCQEAFQRNCNLIITHEGIWYSHRDQMPDTLPHGTQDPVYQQKQEFLRKNNLLVYRYHDGIHRALPDRITAGLLRSLEWEDTEIIQEAAYSILELHKPLGKILSHIQTKLGMSYLRYMGSPDFYIRRALVAVGYRGGGNLILPLIEKEKIDLVIYGEGPEWEIPEYIRDAQAMGFLKALIILGHGESEGPGMYALTLELQRKFPSLPIHYLAHQPLFAIFK
ncbi:MAG: Nif3-like dinuclear metal center hexameric protein [Treponemataceae bacterium]|nr:Nif3-like dinuclear metal center hexameric protein [Treponemataceae bacterium]